LRFLEDLPSKIATYLEKNLSLSDNRRNVTTYNFMAEERVNSISSQTQMRELFHSFMTPLSAVDTSINIVDISKNDDDFEKVFKQEWNSIKIEMQVIKALLYAYRGLAMLNFNSEECNINLNHAITDLIRWLSTENKKTIIVKNEINKYFKESINYSSQFLIALFLPLLQNAVEASPKDGEITLKSIDHEEKSIIEIKNSSLVKVDDATLQNKESTKDSHEGLGLSTVNQLYCYISQ
jgi:signal transduction histidine kinase